MIAANCDQGKQLSMMTLYANVIIIIFVGVAQESVWSHSCRRITAEWTEKKFITIIPLYKHSSRS